LRVVSRSLLDRYQDGDHRGVWDQLTQLGPAVRDTRYLSDANSIGFEMMRRARHNVEQIIEKLDALGYRFTNHVNHLGSLEDELKPDLTLLPSLGNPSVFKAPKASASEDLDVLEHLTGGPLPLSIRHWWEQIGFVCLSGVHETLSPGLDPDGAGGLVIWEYDFKDPLDLTSFNETGFQLALERDAYAIRLPDASADVKIRPDLWFVPYLRRVFEWGGFPGWATLEFRRPEKELMYLREGLLPL
jgi:hypothetical protein